MTYLKLIISWRKYGEKCELLSTLLKNKVSVILTLLVVIAIPLGNNPKIKYRNFRYLKKIVWDGFN